MRQGRCRAEDRRKPLSGGWSESGFPPVCKMAGRACEAHMRTGERYCDSSIFPGAAATSASPRIKRAPSSPQRNRSCPSSNTERGAGRRHIPYFVPALSSAPAKSTEPADPRRISGRGYRPLRKAAISLFSPRGEKRELYLPLEGGGRRSAAGGGDHGERHNQLCTPQITPPRSFAPTLPLKGRVKPQQPLANRLYRCR